MKSFGIKRSYYLPALLLYPSVARIAGSHQPLAASHWSSQQRGAGQRGRSTVFGTDGPLWLVDFDRRRRQQVIYLQQMGFSAPCCNCWFFFACFVHFVEVSSQKRVGKKLIEHSRIQQNYSYNWSLLTNLKKYRQNVSFNKKFDVWL